MRDPGYRSTNLAWFPSSKYFESGSKYFVIYFEIFRNIKFSKYFESDFEIFRNNFRNILGSKLIYKFCTTKSDFVFEILQKILN